MRVHFIAIGGSVMHNLAIALHKKGYEVTGSDDELFEPAKGRLLFNEIVPRKGWYPEDITKDIDAIILGMHAKADNPELKKAQELGLKIYSFPEFVYEQAKGKKRVVVAGSHGKTTITAMVVHVLAEAETDFDYLIGARVDGLDDSVRITKNAPISIFEGDEYLTSPLDPRPKFLHYHPHVALISGIAWDHFNVFPTFEEYIHQFEEFVESLKPGTILIYNAEDENVVKVVKNARSTVKLVPYKTPRYQIQNEKFVMKTIFRFFPLEVTGKHNVTNIEAARMICKELGIDDMNFFQTISTFKGAGKRLELVEGIGNTLVFKDFAHSPSKVKATLEGVREQYEERTLMGVLELHTFSSLNKKFLPEYKGTADSADDFAIYINPKAIEAKGLDPISPEEIRKAFGRDDIQVFDDHTKLLAYLNSKDLDDSVLIMMSSGNFNGMDFSGIGKKMVS